MDEQSHRFPWRVTAIVVVIVVAASVAAGVLLARERVQPSATPTTSAAVSPSGTGATALPADPDRQVTVLLTVRDEDGTAASSVLLGVGGNTGHVSELMLPRALLLATTPATRLAQAPAPNGGSLAAGPLQTLLGVQVDAVVDLDRLAWGGLLDGTGARADPVLAKQPGSFPLVVDTVLAGLPADPGRVSQLLTGLGSMARTTITNEDAGRVLAGLGQQLRVQGADRQVLPVTYVRGGEDRAAIVRRAEADVLVARLFPDALLRPGHGGPLRVVVQRAGATVGAELAAQLALADADMGVVVDRSTGSDVATTRVVVASDSAAARAAGEQVATALGLPATAVGSDPTMASAVDVRVLLGPDAPATGR